MKKIIFTLAILFITNNLFSQCPTTTNSVIKNQTICNSFTCNPDATFMGNIFAVNYMGKWNGYANATTLLTSIGMAPGTMMSYSDTLNLSNRINTKLAKSDTTNKWMWLGMAWTKSQSDTRYLQSFTESDPVYKADSNLYARKTYLATALLNYYTKTQSDSKYYLATNPNEFMTSFTEVDPTVSSSIKAIDTTKILLKTAASALYQSKGSYALSAITYTKTQVDSIKTTITKTFIGLGSVDNTSDLSKPISTLTQTALNAKQVSITTGTTSQYLRGDLSLATFPTSLPPSGLASGDITGSYPSPTLTTTGITAGTYVIGSITVDAKGRVTGITTKTSSVVSRTIGTAFQINSGNSAADVNYSILISNVSVLAGTALGTVSLATSTTSGGAYTTISTSGYGVSGLVSTATNTQTIGGFIDRNLWVKIIFTPTTTGIGSTSAVSYQTGQETTY